MAPLGAATATATATATETETATETVKAGVSLMLAIPARMIALSVILAPPLSRRLTIIFGLAYTGIEVMTLTSPHLFYKVVVVSEVFTSLAIVALAARWPKASEQ